MASKTTAAPEEHSSVVGGSSAEKRIACPASYQLEQKLPPSAKSESSDFADEGTALHEAMSYILLNDVLDLDDIRGQTFGVSETSPAGYVMTDDLVDGALAPCVDFFEALDAESDEEGGLQFLVENRVEMPGIPKAFGTADLICKTDVRSIVPDWKFGVGVLVKAFYLAKEEPPFHIGVDGDGMYIVPNAQLMFYGRAAMHSFPHMFGTDPDWPVDLYIVQPRAKDGDPDAPFSKITVTVKQLDEFRWALVAAVAEAMGDEPRMRKGPHCRFAQCKVICPLFTGAALDGVKLDAALKGKKKGSVLDGLDINWSTQYGELLDLAVLAEAFAAEARAQAHAFLEQGNVICDEDGNKTWILVQKKPTLKYTDESGMVKMAMTKYGLTTEEVMTKPETKSPAQLRDAIAAKLPGKTKKAREEAAKELIKPYAANVSSGTTLAPNDGNRREFVPIASNVAALAGKLSALAKG